MLSFIIPVFNPDITVFKRCCKSIIDQSLTDWEAIFVLDGKNNTVQSIIESYGNKSFHVKTIEHGGACKARNEGQKEAKGEYYVFWDCDCQIEPHTAKMWVNTFEKEPEIAFIYSGYKFLEEGAINSEPFDPYTLKIRNYISTCFPLRKEFFVPFDETIESLQDWDFWLSVVELGGVGKYIPGYAFSTPLPTKESISGKGCTHEIWLERVNKVKTKHNLPFRNTCVSALGYKMEGIRLAKLIDADYQDMPEDKPHDYKRIVKVGFSLNPSYIGFHTATFKSQTTKKYLFWTAENVEEINNGISAKALHQYSTLLNRICEEQYVEDYEALKIMERCGFSVKVNPIPLINDAEIKPMPVKPKWLVDISAAFTQIMVVIERAMPYIDFEVNGGVHKLEDYTGLISLRNEGILTFEMKRMLVTGRHIISNVQQPFCGYVDDTQDLSTYIPAIVEKIRLISNSKEVNQKAVDYYAKVLSQSNIKGLINESQLCNPVV